MGRKKYSEHSRKVESSILAVRILVPLNASTSTGFVNVEQGLGQNKLD
jgi:hypothetical protein